MPRRALLLLLVLAACTTPKKRFEQGQEAEAEGRWAEAAAKYIDALRRDPGYPGAREKALETGNRALEDYARVAAGLEEAGRWQQAADEYRRADALMESAASVRVVLQPPPGYRESRRGAFDQAFELAMGAADASLSQGRWHDAAQAYAAAAGSYEPSAQQRDRAQEGRFRALLAGANAEMEAGRFGRADQLAGEAAAIFGPEAPRSRPAVQLQAQIRSRHYLELVAAARQGMNEGRFQHAFMLVDEALAVYGPDAQESAEARDLRVRIIELGTVHLAVTPVWRDERIGPRVPAALLTDLNDILDDEHWNEPPLFVAVPDPGAVRKQLRQLEFDHEVLSVQRASAVARTLGAEFAAVLFLSACDYDRGERPEPREVATRAGPPGQVKLYRTRSLRAACTFRLVDARSGQLVVEGTVEASAERRLDHATCDGNLGDLLLTQEQHAWFDVARIRAADREIEREVAAGLASGVANAVYDELVKHLP